MKWFQTKILSVTDFRVDALSYPCLPKKLGMGGGGGSKTIKSILVTGDTFAIGYLNHTKHFHV